MGVRVWGVVEDRLVEVLVRPGAGFLIEGLPASRCRTTADRVRAALINAGLVPEMPSVVVGFAPALLDVVTLELDLAIAIALLVELGAIDGPLGWILAAGRLGLDGALHAEGLEERTTVADVVRVVCQTHALASEHMFESGQS